MRMLVLGNSHLASLRYAHAAMVAEQAADGLEMDFVVLHRPEYQPVVTQGVLHPQVMAALAARPYDLYISMAGGNDHAVMSLLNHPQLFDFVLPEAPGLAVTPGAQVLPAAMVMEELARRVDESVQVLTAYRKAVSGTLVHIESPPPIPSVAHIEAYADAAFAGLVTERGVSPAAFRYKFWRLQSLLYRLSCQRLGVAFLPVPAELCDAEGMLVEAAWGHDATHANTLFGRCVLPRLREMAARC